MSMEDIHEEYEMNIFLRVMKTMALKVRSSDKINSVKAKLALMDGITTSQQELFFAGNHLKDDMTVSDYRIPKNATLDLYIGAGIEIFVVIPTRRKTITIGVKILDVIHCVKTKIQEKEGIPLNEQVLIYSGRPLDDGQTVIGCNITKGSTLHLLFRPRDDLQISITMRNGKTITAETKTWYTVQDVKMIIESIEHVPAAYQKLFYAGKELEDHPTLSHCNITDGSALELTEIMQILVKPWSGSTITVTVEKDCTIDKVMYKILEKDNFPGLQTLLFAGKKLHGSRTLADYDIQSGSTLHLHATFGAAEPSRILVDTLNGMTMSLDARLDTRLREIKVMIHEMSQIPCEKQKLSYDGSELNDDNLTLKVYKIKLGSRLLLDY